MSKALGKEPEIEEVSPELDEIKKDPLNSVVGDITTQDDPQIKQSASTPSDLWESWLDKQQSEPLGSTIGKPQKKVETQSKEEFNRRFNEAEKEDEKTMKRRGLKHRSELHGYKAASTPSDLWKTWLETRKFQGMGDARYGNQHETGNSDDYMSQQVKDDNVYIGSQDKEDKEDEKKDEREDEKVDEKNDKPKQDN